MRQPAGARAAAPVRVGLLGMYASANLGDTAIQTAVMHALRERRSDIEFIALCTAPDDAAQTFGLSAHHVSGFGFAAGGDGVPAAAHAASSLWERAPVPVRLAATAWRAHRVMRELDMLLVSGSGQIDDFWGGPWEQPFRLLAWSSAARRQSKPAAYFGVGVDQLLTRAGRWLVTAAMRRAQLRVVRDAGSRQALQTLRLNAPCDVCPDPAFHLKPPCGAAAGGGQFAVISPIARNAWPGVDDQIYAAYLGALAAAADHLQRRGLEVRFVCSQTKMDPPVVAHVKAAMRCNPEGAPVITPVSVDDYIRLVSGAAVVLASRLHALILALVAGTPVVGVAYSRKVTQQMADAGLAGYSLALATLQTAELLDRVDSVLADSVSLRQHIDVTTAQFRLMLDARFDALAALMPATRIAGVSGIATAAR